MFRFLDQIVIDHVTFAFRMFKFKLYEVSINFRGAF